MQPYKTQSSRIVWSCPWYNIRQDEIVTANGEMGVYNIVQHPGAVWILPVTPVGEVVLIHTFRYAVNDWCYEIPAGSINPGESLEQSARREMLEEIGGTAVNLEYIGWFYTMNGIGNEKAHLFLATDVNLGQPEYEATEVMEVIPMPIPEVLRMAQNNEISDGPSALALLLCAEKLQALAEKA